LGGGGEACKASLSRFAYVSPGWNGGELSKRREKKEREAENENRRKKSDMGRLLQKNPAANYQNWKPCQVGGAPFDNDFRVG